MDSPNHLHAKLILQDTYRSNVIFGAKTAKFSKRW